MRAQLPERQVCHAPGDGSLLEVARDQQLRFVRVARFLPNAFPVWIAPAEHVLDRVEGIDHVVRMSAGEASREAVIAGLGTPGRRRPFWRCWAPHLGSIRVGLAVSAQFATSTVCRLRPSGLCSCTYSGFTNLRGFLKACHQRALAERAVPAKRTTSSR